MSKRIKLFILASVVLNLIFMGMFAGHAYRRYGIQREGQIIALLDKSSIDKAQRDALREKLVKNMPGKDKWKDKKKWREDTIAILTAKDFDVAAYRNQLELMLQDQQSEKRQKVEVIIELASKLNQQERMALADIFRRSRR